METRKMGKDIVVFYVEASSFPDGVLAAHQKLHSMVPFSTERKYFGISRPEDGVIRYKAAAEELAPNEGASHDCKTLVLEKGHYYNITIPDFMKNISAIGEAFQQILQEPDIDQNGYCVEWYYNDKDVHCMVRKADS